MKGLAYLLTYFIAVVIAAVAWNQLRFKHWINFGIYWKILISHSRPSPWTWVCGLGIGLGLAYARPKPWP